VSVESRKALLFLVATAAVVGLVALFGVRLLGLAAGPESEITSLLKGTESGSLTLALGPPGKQLVSTRHHFDRIVVESDARAGTAEAVATLDFEGRLGGTKVSSLGLETLQFALGDGGWKAREGFAPRLVQIARALEARRQALEAGDLDTLAKLSGRTVEQVRADPELSHLLAVEHRRYDVAAWYVRSERGEVVISEDYRLEGGSAEQPVDEKGSRRLRLNQTGREFMFGAGLM
jgi:hypothetical protein